MSIAAKLKAARNVWKESKVPSFKNKSKGGFENLPDGKYRDCEIIQAEMKEDKNGGVGILLQFQTKKGKKQTKWLAVIDRKGRPLPADRMRWVKQAIKTLTGKDVDIDELEDVVADLVGKFCDITVRSSEDGDYTNVYVASRAIDPEDSDDDDDDDDDEEEDEDDEDADEEEDEEEEEEEQDSDEDEEEEDDDESDVDEADRLRAPKKKKSKSRR